MSLGMSFARRRMMVTVNGGPKYVWSVYNTAYVRDDATAITGNVSLSRARMVSKTYAVDESGFTLVDPSSKSAILVRSGDCFVDLENVTSTVVSGPYLYVVNRVTQSGVSPVPFEYTRYSAKIGRSGSELYRIESNTLDYPIDGEQDGYWYVLVEGEV